MGTCPWAKGQAADRKMPQLSTLRGPLVSGLRSASVTASKHSNNARNVVQVRRMGDGPRTMPMIPSQYTHNDTKDRFHFYLTLTGLPLALFITYMQVRIGPAKLVETPEGYVPKEYEYYKDPIQRALVKNFPNLYPSHPKQYERSLYWINEEAKNQEARMTAVKVKELNTTRQDLTGWYFVPYDIHEKEETLRQVKQKAM